MAAHHQLFDENEVIFYAGCTTTHCSSERFYTLNKPQEWYTGFVLSVSIPKCTTTVWRWYDKWLGLYGKGWGFSDMILRQYDKWSEWC